MMDSGEEQFFLLFFGKGIELQMPHIHTASAGKLADLAKV